jgi:hypothetical protein
MASLTLLVSLKNTMAFARVAAAVKWLPGSHFQTATCSTFPAQF